jgi:anaerobic magnesium-protoporphyrin IX monomethyl ester cyclase
MMESSTPMDILLAHGYFLYDDPHERAVMRPYPPLGLLYVSSHLKAKGFSVGVFDSTFSSLTEFKALIQRERPGMVGLYCTLMTKQNVLQMAEACRKLGIKVILGGPEPPYYADEYLARGADVIVIGEGELTLEELIPHIAQHGLHRLWEVQGIAFRDDMGQTIRTTPRPYISDLSLQPMPDREAIDLQHYVDIWRKHHGMGSISLVCARGCPYTCTWCSHSVFGESHRRRSPQNVADEVEYLVGHYKPDQFWYVDDVFTMNWRWMKDYHAELKRRNLKIPFECISRADRLNDEMIDILAEMGCMRLWIGSESGSQRILDAMQRKADVLDVQAKSQALKRRGIETGMFIMLGYSGETFPDLQATVDHLKKSNPDIFLTTVAYPIKGTRFYQEVEGKGSIIAPHSWEQRTDRDLGVAGRHSRRYYAFATRWMVNSVHLHKLRLEGNVKQYPQIAKTAMNMAVGRVGMMLTGREIEEPQKPSGRGWYDEKRTTPEMNL